MGQPVSAFRPDLLQGKVALVTGGGSGIGYGIARAFLAHGATVAITSRNHERLAAAAETLASETGGTTMAVGADVRDAQAVERALDQVLARCGRLDIVVNGAAGNFLAPAAALSSNGFRAVLDIDTVGTYNVSRAAFDKALRDHGGNIINISATLHYGATPLQVHAASAKAAIDAMTRVLAVEWGPLGIRVNAIAPGPIEDTEGARRLAVGDIRQQLERVIPIRRFGTIQEIASVAVFLASDAASLIHGAVIVADGGAWLTRPTTDLFSA